MSTSTLLRHEPLALLNQLLHLDSAQVVVQGEGVTLLHRTAFGVFMESQRDGLTILNDPVSGLTLTPEKLGDIYAIPLSPGLPAALRIELRDSLASLTIQAGSGLRDSQILDRVFRSFGTRTIQTELLLQRGAGAWLDEWGDRREPVSSAWSLAEVCAAVEHSTELNARIELPGLTAFSHWTPEFVDADHTTVKIANLAHGHVVFIDASHPANDFLELFDRLDFLHRASEMPLSSPRLEISERAVALKGWN